jgi:GAF domain-containing protein
MVSAEHEHEDSGDGSRRDPLADAGAAARGLRDSLAALSHLATGRLSLSETLGQVAELALNAIPGADGAGLTLLEQNRADTMVATAPFVEQVDAVQYGLGQGPCISAAAHGVTIRADSLGGVQRWPRGGSPVARMNVHSALSLPLLTTEGVVGSMNIYSHTKSAFDDQAVQLGELFAVPAAIAAQNAQVLAQTRRLAAELQSALASRAVIDQAIGILMSRTGSSADEAFASLRTMSQSQHQKLSVVATSVVDQAIRRARARRAQQE